LNTDKNKVTIGLMTKYVGRQYVDNSGRDASRIPSYTFTDLRASYEFRWNENRRIALYALVRNLFNSKYETNAWNYRFRSAGYNPVPDDPYAELEDGDQYHLRGYFPQAGTNFLVGLTLAF